MSYIKVAWLGGWWGGGGVFFIADTTRATDYFRRKCQIEWLAQRLLLTKRTRGGEQNILGLLRGLYFPNAADDARNGFFLLPILRFWESCRVLLDHPRPQSQAYLSRINFPYEFISFCERMSFHWIQDLSSAHDETESIYISGQPPPCTGIRATLQYPANHNRSDVCTNQPLA